MASYAIQLRRGTATEHGSFTGLAGEITVNTTRNSIHVHDGTTAGGTELATKASVDGLTVDSISDVTITSPSSGQVLQYNGSAWVNATDEDNLANNDTDDLAEGSTNQYYTDARARGAVSAGGDLSYNSGTGVFSFTERTDSEVRGLVSAGGDLSYNSSTGVFSFTERTDAEVRGLVSAGGDLAYNSTTGVFFIY